MHTKPINFKQLFLIDIYAHGFIPVLVFNLLLKCKIFMTMPLEYLIEKILK